MRKTSPCSNSICLYVFNSFTRFLAGDQLRLKNSSKVTSIKTGFKLHGFLNLNAVLKKSIGLNFLPVSLWFKVKWASCSWLYKLKKSTQRFNKQWPNWGGGNMDMDSLNKSLGPSSVYLPFALLLLLPTSFNPSSAKRGQPSLHVTFWIFVSLSKLVLWLFYFPFYGDNHLLRPWIKADLWH